MAEILRTEVMDNDTHTLGDCCFANVRLPLTFSPRNSSNDLVAEKVIRQSVAESQVEDDGSISVVEAPKIQKWIMERAVMDFDTHIPTKYHAGAMWVRLSGQIYLELKDFEWAGYMLKELCERVLNGEGRS